MDLDTLHAFEGEVRKAVPNFKLTFKDESLFQKILGFFAFPFNPQFMTRYTTTFGATVAFPSRVYYESQPRSSFTVLSHEMVHMMDQIKHPVLYQLSYAVPQALAVLPLAAFAILAGHHAWVLLLIAAGLILGCALARITMGGFWVAMIGSLVAASVFAILTTGWTSGFLFGGLALAAPWPAPWRCHWEMRGYIMNMAVLQWTMGPLSTVVRDLNAKHFTGPDYYFMAWSGHPVKDQLDAGSQAARNGTLQTDTPYGIVYAFLAGHGELRKVGNG